MSMQLYKLTYDWYEGEHEETLLAKDIDLPSFEIDIIDAKDYAQSRIGLKYKKSEFLKPYNVECLPEYYKTIVDYLQTQKGYIEIHTNDDVYYEVHDRDDYINGKSDTQIDIIKVEICKTRKNGKPGGKFVPVDFKDE